MSNRSDTIFALSTIMGRSGVAVIRVSGENAMLAASYLNSSVTSLSPRLATIAKLYSDEGFMLDEAILIFFPEPRSFTGENVLEIHLHGSIAVINNVHQQLAKHIRPADKGEFTKRAFLNGKIDLTKAEAISDLIHANTKEQLKQATKQFEGKLHIIYQEWRKSLIYVSGLIEAYIDFPEEEIPLSLINTIKTQIKEIRKKMDAHLQDNRIGEKIRDGIKVAIIGPANSGKSTLFNYILGRKMSIVSEIPGTTRDAIEVIVDISGYQVCFIDTAGLRDAMDSIEQEGMRITTQHAMNSDYKIALFPADSINSLDYKTTSLIDLNTIPVLSKIDLLGAPPYPYNVTIEDKKLITISTDKEFGIEFLIEALKKKIIQDSTSDSTHLTRARHRKAVLLCLESLKDFDVEYIELAAENLRRAIYSIETLIGKITVDEILSEIFNNFCIGK